MLEFFFVLALSLNSQGLDASAKGRYPDAARFYGNAVQVWRHGGETYRPHLAVSLTNLGQARQNSGDWIGAIEAYREAVSLDPSAEVLSRLGGALAALGQTAEAEPLLLKALSLQPALSLEAANTMNNLALLYAQSGQWKRAEPLVQQAIQIFHGSKSPETAMLLTNLASLHLQQGHPERAEPLFRKARLMLDSEHPQLAMVLSQEGLMLLQLNKTQLALERLSQAVDISRRSTGKDSLDTSIAETNLAQVYLRTGKRREAEKILTHALAVQESIYKGRTRELDITRESLAASRKGRP